MQWDNGMVLLWYIVVPLPAALCNPWVEKNTDNTFQQQNDKWKTINQAEMKLDNTFLRTLIYLFILNLFILKN